MSSKVHNQYLPDYVSPPGETLLEVLEERGMSQADLADRTGRPKKTISEIINGKAAITTDTALQLERVLGISASFWNSREQKYREFLARQQEQARLQVQIAWLEKVPVKEMIKLGWIEKSKEKVEQLQIVLNFFGVVSPEQCDVYWGTKALAFRKSVAFESDRIATNAWLRKGELDAQKIECAPYDAEKFKRALEEIRSLTVENPKEAISKVKQLCAAAGVVVVLVPSLKGVRASGVTRWLTPTKALIQLSFRYKRDDRFWFTFFHESGHVLQERKRDVFIETDEKKDYDPNDAMEKGADEFAANLLIPKQPLQQFLENGKLDDREISLFATELGIAPAIVVGRLHHDGVLAYNRGNNLRRKIDWDDFV
ncbi:HigA family addiction module antitoxin [Tumidithrix elongata RA019]|uniref:HigA family addiction module antitoxin n=1 Tax=Tumidithrix elongata BACA0141 TaxID=2716417 RepID=A0AAW9Q2A5_9CYAN|nr:HigA family addiction module antitoxin [Tumidithrix elongata RA019]